MDSSLLSLFIALYFGLSAHVVESQQNVIPSPQQSPPPPPPPPESPPPPPFTPPPGMPSPPPFATPPPFSHPQSPPPPVQSPPHPRHSPPPPFPRKRLRLPRPEHGDHNRKHLNPPPRKEKLNAGKMIGLMFIGVSVILQVCVVAFLLVRRRQLLKGENCY